MWLDVEVRPAAASREGGVFGLLGDVDGDAENDIALPDGSGLEIPVAWSTLHGSYADAWRVSEETSLFVYGEDESAADYAGAGIPGVIALELADPDELSAAERICGDVEDLSLFGGCLVDVMCGGADADAAAKWYLTEVEPDNFLTVTPPNSITSFSSGPVSCADSGDPSVTLSDTLELNVISGCNYYQDSNELYLYFGRVDEHDDPIGSSYVAVQITDFAGIGMYSTDASTTGTFVSVTSDGGYAAREAASKTILTAPNLGSARSTCSTPTCPTWFSKGVIGRMAWYDSACHAAASSIAHAGQMTNSSPPGSRTSRSVAM